MIQQMREMLYITVFYYIIYIINCATDISLIFSSEEKKELYASTSIAFLKNIYKLPAKYLLSFCRICTNYNL